MSSKQSARCCLFEKRREAACFTVHTFNLNLSRSEAIQNGTDSRDSA